MNHDHPSQASSRWPNGRQLIRLLIPSVVIGLAVFGALWLTHLGEIENIGKRLQSIAADAAAGIDGGIHNRLRGKDASRDADFTSIRDHLRAVKSRYALNTEIYTLRRAGPNSTQFIVMTNETPFSGDTYALRQEMQAAFERGQRAHTGLYGDEHGLWISGYAPIQGLGEKVEALVCIDHQADALRAQGLVIMLKSMVSALGAALLLALLNAVGSRQGNLIDKLRRLPRRSLTMRIGLSGSGAVLAAITLSGLLNYSSQKKQSIAQLREHLLTTARVGVSLIEGKKHLTLHQIEAAAGLDSIPPKLRQTFLDLRTTLREIKAAAKLESPVYTLRQDGGRTRFVVMSNERPFVGDAYELREPMKQSFKTGEAGSDGPYTDAHGVWLSAWAPILNEGESIAMLQADYEIGILLSNLRNQALEQTVFALVGVLLAFFIAFWSARSLSRPISKIASATSKIEGGDFEVSLDLDREDEVGVLARSVDNMAKGLRERERLRQMFGRYMSRQVVNELLHHEQLEVQGELRNLTIMITDIRGYTNLTEKLGAEEVVALLNDYFAILVDEVTAQDGIVDKFMGDAMLCWFGAPVPQPLHPTRAVTTASRMLSRLAAWNGERVAQGNAPVETGIGIATGRVVVGNIGSSTRLEYTAIGDAVNLSSRLCSLAAGGEIILDDATASQIAMSCEDAGEVRVKGVSKPLSIFKITV